MRCVKPFVTREGAYGCGQCLPCRVTKRRTWAHRILLEAIQHGGNCSFVTLTYSEDRRELDPVHLQRWLKRFRREVEPIKIRFFAVGEYGDISQRPHYHAALFGWPSCRGGRVVDGACQCHACSVVRSTWSYGHVMVARLEPKSAAYIAGYVTKKMTHSSDTRLGGKHPEFARMSLRPGIGADVMWDVASEILKYNLQEKIPNGLRYGAVVMPLGKYLTKKLRVMVGKSEKATAETLQLAANQMQILRAFAWENNRSVSSVFQELFGPVEAAMAAKIQKRGKL